MFHLALFEPEIPPNTGNIIRLCANTGTQLHLIHPLGFCLADKQLKRAGLDYHEYASVAEYPSFKSFFETLHPARMFALSTKGISKYHQVNYQAGDVFLLGPESRGLPAVILDGMPAANILRIPMLSNSRSLNLSNAASIVLYEAWRQNHFL